MCRYNASPYALDFDHRDPDTKLFNISARLVSASWEELLAEIAKCDVRCRNCHGIRTAEQRAAKAFKFGGQRKLLPPPEPTA